MGKTRYAVWGRDRSYPWLWLAAVIAGYDAFKKRYNQRTTHISRVINRLDGTDY